MGLPSSLPCLPSPLSCTSMQRQQTGQQQCGSVGLSRYGREREREGKGGRGRGREGGREGKEGEGREREGGREGGN